MSSAVTQMPIRKSYQASQHLFRSLLCVQHITNPALRSLSSCQQGSIPTPTTVASLQAHDEKTKHDGQRLVVLHGLIRSVRKQKRVAFAALSDGTTLEPAQVVLKPEQAER